ncbi:hypothetical protein BU25DRAFT_136858 [Macroventuria anomochaeta]|uniref:Uncharacterized protein n=1 Tax=Macroventuria anomochaeta TaxID=301207 RepID=A0ACB6SF86_9PLEO|nr:uncharacterized protein BU25DRAFT_136858 [Macroventuria anomochaeta]KAF2631979.1 hypothetical protein BU25DRAFT_136858 [Macroventuria anomochaeta]
MGECFRRLNDRIVRPDSVILIRTRICDVKAESRWRQFGMTEFEVLIDFCSGVGHCSTLIATVNDNLRLSGRWNTALSCYLARRRRYILALERASP